MEIRALQEVEPWTGGSLVAGIVLAIVAVAALVWFLRRFLRG